MSIVAPKERKHLSADGLFHLVRNGFANIPDSRGEDVDIAAIPAYTPKVLRDYGSEQLSERFDHPVVSFDVRFVIGHDRLSCGTQTYVVIEA